MDPLPSFILPAAGPVFLLVLGILIGWTFGQHNTVVRRHAGNPVPVWVMGLMVGLLLLPFVLTIGHLLVGLRIDSPALGGILFLLLLGGWWNATHARLRR